jgi:hypothetical protein
MPRKCVRFKMTSSGKRCASFSKARSTPRRRSMSGMEGVDELTGLKRHCVKYKRVKAKGGKYVKKCASFKAGRGAPSSRARRKAGIKSAYRNPLKKVSASKRRHCTRWKKVGGVRKCAKFAPGARKSAKGRGRAAARGNRRSNAATPRRVAARGRAPSRRATAARRSLENRPRDARGRLLSTSRGYSRPTVSPWMRTIPMTLAPSGAQQIVAAGQARLFGLEMPRRRRRS